MNYQSNRSNFQRNSELMNLDADLILNSGLEDTEKFLKHAEEFALKSGISTNQLRDLFDLIRPLKDNSDVKAKQQIAKILIKLEYAFRRKSILPPFYFPIKPVLELLLKSSDDAKKRGNFVDFMEAVVAYSKDKK